MTNENGRKTKRLSREILGLLLITAVIALFFWGFLYLTANSISETYFAERNLQPSEGQWLTLRAWIRSVSLLSTVILFLVLFLFLLGQKLDFEDTLGFKIVANDTKLITAIIVVICLVSPSVKSWIVSKRSKEGA